MSATTATSDLKILGGFDQRRNPFSGLGCSLDSRRILTKRTDSRHGPPESFNQLPAAEPQTRRRHQDLNFASKTTIFLHEPMYMYIPAPRSAVLRSPSTWAVCSKLICARLMQRLQGRWWGSSLRHLDRRKRRSRSPSSRRPRARGERRKNILWGDPVACLPARLMHDVAYVRAELSKRRRCSTMSTWA